jgi:hypothetical protein
MTFYPVVFAAVTFLGLVTSRSKWEITDGLLDVWNLKNQTFYADLTFAAE